MADDMRRQIAALIKKWDRWHDPNCCITGCSNSDGQHRVAVREDDGTITPTGWVDCFGYCTCQVEAFVRDLREVIAR